MWKDTARQCQLEMDNESCRVLGICIPNIKEPSTITLAIAIIVILAASLSVKPAIWGH